MVQNVPAAAPPEPPPCVRQCLLTHSASPVASCEVHAAPFALVPPLDVVLPEEVPPVLPLDVVLPLEVVVLPELEVVLPLDVEVLPELDELDVDVPEVEGVLSLLQATIRTEPPNKTDPKTIPNLVAATRMKGLPESGSVSEAHCVEVTSKLHRLAAGARLRRCHTSANRCDPGNERSSKISR